MGDIKQMIEFKFELKAQYIEHIKDVSYYNHNYYKLNLSRYGDFIIPAKCNILYEESEDDCDYSYYSLGYFDENNKFVACFTWLDENKEF
jgi:hypothetical protein